MLPIHKFAYTNYACISPPSPSSSLLLPSPFSPLPSSPSSPPLFSPFPSLSPLPSPPPPPHPAHQRATSQAHVGESGAAFLLDVLPNCTAQETAQLAQVSHTHAPVLEGAACCGCVCGCVCACVGVCWRADSVVCAVQRYSGDQG